LHTKTSAPESDVNGGRIGIGISGGGGKRRWWRAVCARWPQQLLGSDSDRCGGGSGEHGVDVGFGVGIGVRSATAPVALAASPIVISAHATGA